MDRLMGEEPFIAGERVTLADCVAMATPQAKR
jgi:glutathione S-transferase